jgi:hypothetical protein
VDNVYQIWFDGLFEDDLLVVQTADQEETGMESLGFGKALQSTGKIKH